MDLRKHKWERCRQKLSKILQKDSINAGAHYVFAHYFFTTDNPAYNIDSAYLSLVQSIDDYGKTSLKYRERLKKLPLDSALLIHFRAKIDSAAFVRAKQVNTEEAFIDFAGHFPYAAQRTLALQLRDEAAFNKALGENSFTAFDRFLEKYPDAKQAAEAKRRYDRLLYEDRTRDGRLTSYENFLHDFSQSPYRADAEKHVFEIATAGGAVDCIVNFLTKYGHSAFSERARNILYHLNKEPDAHLSPEEESLLDTDSLKSIRNLDSQYLVSFFADNRYGFMNSEGKVVLGPSAEEIDPNYLCGHIVEDVLVIENKIIARNGAIIYEGTIDELDDLGSGILSITANNCNTVIHKSGYRIGAKCADEVKLLAGRYIALRNQRKWSLYALNGKALISSAWDDITEVNRVVAVQLKDKWHLLTSDEIGLLADQRPLKLSNSFDEVRAWPHQLLWVRQGQKEGVLDGKLAVKIPPDNYSLKAQDVGILVSSSAGTAVYDYKKGMSSYFPDIRVNVPWVSVKVSHGWRLFDVKEKKFLSQPYDSISFKGVFAVGHLSDTLRVYFNHDDSLDFHNVTLRFIPTKDSSSFLLVDDGQRKAIYDSNARHLFELVCDNIQYGEENVFVFNKKEKKGLISADGKLLLQPDYDAIGDAVKQGIPLLKKMKFGRYDLRMKKEIKPAYDKNLRPYNEWLLMAFKNSFYGLIDADNKLHLSFEYEDIKFWNDSIAFVKKDSWWMLLNIESKNLILDRIKDFHFVSDTEQEKVAIIRQENGYGVFSNTRGVIIPPTFTDIINLGSSENPLYFTEKNVEEASIFVVIYYNKDGKLVRRQAFEADDYEKIYCSGNN